MDQTEQITAQQSNRSPAVLMSPSSTLSTWGTRHAASSTTSPTCALSCGCAALPPATARARLRHTPRLHPPPLTPAAPSGASLVWPLGGRALPAGCRRPVRLRPDPSAAGHLRARLRQHPAAPHRLAPVASRPATPTRAVGATGNSHSRQQALPNCNSLVCTYFSHSVSWFRLNFTSEFKHWVMNWIIGACICIVVVCCHEV